MSAGNSEFALVGGGVVGLSIAIGLLKSGHQVVVLNGDDRDLRASQGNFGLVWLQDKGPDFAPYAKWTRQAVEAWPDFSQFITGLSGTELAFDQSGGFEFFTDAKAMQEYASRLERQQEFLGNRFSFEMVSGDDLRREHCDIGQGVVGAAYCPLDGHVNPLKLVSALRASVLALGGRIIPDAFVTDIEHSRDGSFELSLRQGGHFLADRIVLSAGLGSNPLARKLGFATQVWPQRGELLITEKLADTLPFLSSTIRQVDEGGIQIGGTAADVGPDDSETLDVMTKLARHAVSVFPKLTDIRVVRAWGALRVMSPDAYPVYQKSDAYPGASLVTCHSGITLASLHGTVLADWLVGNSEAPDLEAFDENRFSISEAA